MEPPPRNFSGLLNQGLNQDTPTQYHEGSGQISPPPHSQIPFATSNFLQNFNPFGPPGVHPPYGHSPHTFQGVPQQGSWQQAPPPSFQGFHLQESLGASASNRSPPVLQFGNLGGAAANTCSHGSESSSRYSAQQEKQSVNIEDLSASSEEEEEEPKRRQRINWTPEENGRLFDAWTKHSTDPVIGMCLLAVRWPWTHEIIGHSLATGVRCAGRPRTTGARLAGRLRGGCASGRQQYERRPCPSSAVREGDRAPGRRASARSPLKATRSEFGDFIRTGCYRS
ncbi:hypothetical protein BDA96_07G066600 [Sorghum bicolor]|uniref:Myb-like domain-containing protein n=2 Tax=Sorghum bicolor TaxID=4558 RepID=A0A921U8W7_SORBI|nr:hypothetical protein SORBI_3007G064000 [Sorghum bicolor]KAG0522774.1 hypothetical protein BDA96_07G066600 [Sorghum bicolor]